MAPAIVDFMTHVSPERVDSLRILLKEIAAQVESNSYLTFASLRRLHFASFVVHDSKEYGTRLVFENNFDGDLDNWLSELCQVAGDALHEIYSHCDGYSVQDPAGGDALAAWLKAHAVHPGAYHVGNTGRTCQQILQERALHAELERFADALTAADRALPQLDLFQRFRTHALQIFPWAQTSTPRETDEERKAARLRLIGFLVLVGGLALLLLPVTAVVVLVLRWKEATDSVKNESANLENLQKLVASEDSARSVQNHMVSVAPLKSGWLRLLTIRLVLHAVNLLARVRSTDGELGGITSIHFAHWTVIDRGKNLLFLSNFDGSWENYLDDFIDKASGGLTAIWSNTVGFPRAEWLVRGGAKDGPRFKAIARDSMTVTDVWYHAYPELTVHGIDNNTSLREGLATVADPAAAAAWLQRL